MARVLVVEDEPNIAAIILFKLRREGHTVRHEGALAPAEAAARELPADVVVLDSSLDGDPLPLLTRLLSGCPVLVLVEARDDAMTERARRAGAPAVLRKPFKPTVLARTVGQLVAGDAGRR